MGDVFDKQLMDIGHDNNRFFEECLEFIGTLFMLLSAGLSVTWSRKKNWWRRTNFAP